MGKMSSTKTFNSCFCKALITVVHLAVRGDSLLKQH